LTGSQAFTVPVIDGSGHPFKQWSTGSTSPTITVTSAGTYTAYYGDITGTVISINPVSISVGIGRNVSIAVNVANVTNLYTWQIHVYYNASCVNCTGASYPSYHIFADKSFAPVTPTLGPNYSVFGASIVGIGRFDGSGTLCLLNFTGLNNGTCPLQFKVEETFLLDSNLNNIPATLKQGSLTVKNAQSTDIDGNGKVDMKDIGLVCHACFTLPGDPFWNSACDVNTDGRIDLKDVASVSRDFGRTG